MRHPKLQGILFHSRPHGMNDSLDEARDGRRDDGELDGVGRALGQRLLQRDADLGKGGVALLRRRQGLREPLLAGEREADTAVELGALGQRRLGGGWAGPGFEGLDVIGGGEVGVVDAEKRGHLGQTPGVGVGAIAVVAELRHAQLQVDALVGVGRGLAGGVHHRVHDAGAQAQGDGQHGGEGPNHCWGA
ncbi:hypothetical protein ABZP36_005171 [Zizania latifolia]